MKKNNDIEIVLPRHIGVIMDGNRRWAKKRALPVKAGHSAGASNFKKIVRHANKLGIEYMTFYAFSTENWKRSEDEVDALMKIFTEYLKDSVNFGDENVRLRFIGDRTPLSDEIKQLMLEAEENSKICTGLTVNLAINYGGQDELVHACKSICEQVSEGKISVDDINSGLIDNNLYTYYAPPLDLLIRPGSEYRISNFMIWQAAYAEFWFTDVLWPDFSTDVFDRAIEEYSRRNRRFGGK